MAVLLYWANYPAGDPDPTGAAIRLQTVTGAVAYAGPVTYTGAGDYAAPPAWTTGTASTSYAIAAVAYDEGTGEYSLVTVGTESTLSAAVTHATSGALEAAGAALAGSAARIRAHPATGVLAGAGADLDGTAARTRVHPASGALEADGAQIDGAAARAGAPPDHATTGALVGSGAAVAGTARRNVTHETSGALTGEASILNAVAVYNRAHAAVGALVAAAAELAAVAARSAPGTLQVITDALRDENNNPVPPGTLVPRAYAIRLTDDVLVTVWVDQVTNGAGSLVLADAALTPVDHVITLASNVGEKPAGAKVYLPA